MRYSSSRGFGKTIANLHPKEKLEAQRRLDVFVRAMEAKQAPLGLGIKKLQENLWEFRVTIALRVLFEWHSDKINFVFLGNHNQVRQFLKHYQ